MRLPILALTFSALFGTSCRTIDDAHRSTLADDSLSDVAPQSVIMDFGAATSATEAKWYLPGERFFAHKPSSLAFTKEEGRLHMRSHDGNGKVETFGWNVNDWIQPTGSGVALPAGIYELELTGEILFTDLYLLLGAYKVNLEHIARSDGEALYWLSTGFFPSGSRAYGRVWIYLPEDQAAYSMGFESWGWGYEEKPGVSPMDLRVGRLIYHGKRWW